MAGFLDMPYGIGVGTLQAPLCAVSRKDKGQCQQQCRKIDRQRSRTVIKPESGRWHKNRQSRSYRDQRAGQRTQP